MKNSEIMVFVNEAEMILNSLMRAIVLMEKAKEEVVWLSGDDYLEIIPYLPFTIVKTLKAKLEMGEDAEEVIEDWDNLVQLALLSNFLCDLAEQFSEAEKCNCCKEMLEQTCEEEAADWKSLASELSPDDFDEFLSMGNIWDSVKIQSSSISFLEDLLDF